MWNLWRCPTYTNTCQRCFSLSLFFSHFGCLCLFSLLLWFINKIKLYTCLASFWCVCLRVRVWGIWLAGVTVVSPSSTGTSARHQHSSSNNSNCSSSSSNSSSSSFAAALRHLAKQAGGPTQSTIHSDPGDLALLPWMMFFRTPLATIVTENAVVPLLRSLFFWFTAS